MQCADSGQDRDRYGACWAYREEDFEDWGVRSAEFWENTPRDCGICGRRLAQKCIQCHNENEWVEMEDEDPQWRCMHCCGEWAPGKWGGRPDWWCPTLNSALSESEQEWEQRCLERLGQMLKRLGLELRFGQAVVMFAWPESVVRAGIVEWETFRRVLNELAALKSEPLEMRPVLEDFVWWVRMRDSPELVEPFVFCVAGRRKRI